jgi:hypothetical protein
VDIDKLTYAEIKQIAALFATPSDVTNPERPHPMVGKYVILRTFAAGVHAGELVSQSGDQAVLKNSRRLWKWVNIKGIALSGLSQYGINVTESKVDTIVPEIAITGVIETIPCQDVAKDTINAA